MSTHDKFVQILLKDITSLLVDSEPGSGQEATFNKLIALEDSFKKSLLKYKLLTDIYRKFIKEKTVASGNILSAKPYFREKNTTFSKYISPAIKNGDVEKLQQFHINYLFIKYIVDNWKGNLPEPSKKILNKLIQTRESLITHNLPLAVNRAKLFHRKVPSSEWSLADFINISTVGLISGIDKFVGKHTRVFNGVCIGHMVGNMIKSYNNTTLKFYPSDKSKIYRANSLKSRLKIDDIDELVEAMNTSYQQDQKKGIKTPKEKITKEEIEKLMSASSCLSLEDKVKSSNFDDEVSLYGSNDPEENLIQKGMIENLQKEILKLPIIEQKILKLKGV